MKTKKKLILHIGAEKTGTTSIQASLDANRQQLLKKGVHIPSFLGNKNHKLLAAYGLDVYAKDIAMSSQPFAEDEEAFRSFKEKLKANMQKIVREMDNGVVVISSEDLHRSPISAIQEISKLLVPLFNEIKIVFFVKRQDVLALSRYGELLKWGYNTSPIPSHLDISLLDFYNYCQIVNNWKSCFSNSDFKIVPVGLATSNFDKDSVDLFYKSVDIDQAELTSVKRQNVTPSSAVLLTMEIFNKFPKYLRNVDKDKVLRLMPHVGSQFDLVARTEASTFYSVFQVGNDFLVKNVNGGIPLFGDSFDMYPLDSKKEILLYHLIKELIILCENCHYVAN